MATLVLRSSCAPLAGRNYAHPGHDADVAARSGAAVVDAHHNAMGDNDAGSRAGLAPRTGATTPSTGAHSKPTTTMTERTDVRSQYRAGVYADRLPDGREARHPSSHRSRLRDSDFIASLRFQCDVTLVPRNPIRDDDSITGDRVAAVDSMSDVNGRAGSSSGRANRLGTLRIAKQTFDPCGTSSVITISELPSTTQVKTNYLLSLTQCEVNVMVGGDTPTVLPVEALPSTFQFSFYGNDNNDSSPSADSTVHSLEGGVHRLGEIEVSFDYSMAMEIYDESVRKSYEENEETEAACKSTTSRNANGDTRVFPKEPDIYAMDSPPWKDAKPFRDKRMSDVAYIMLTLEEKSRFIEKTLVALGCLAVVFVAALAWTLWKISKGKRSRRRRVIVNDAWRHSVPREIGAVDFRDAAANGGNGETEGSAQVQSKRQLIPDASPLHPPSDACDEVKVENSNEKINSSTVSHETTLYLIAPTTPSLQPDAQGPTDERQTNDSLRHWYEDFLSPPTKLKKIEPKSEEDVALSLFSSYKSSDEKDDTHVINDIDTPEVYGAATTKKMYVEEDLSGKKPSLGAKWQNDPRLDTPIRTSFSPSPTSMSVFQLSKHVESAILLDEVSEELSQLSQDAVSNRAEPQAKQAGHKEETFGATHDTADTISDIYQPNGGVESCCVASSLVDIAFWQGSRTCSDSDQSTVGDTGSLETLMDNSKESNAIENLVTDVSSLSIASNDTTEEFSTKREPQSPGCPAGALVSQEANIIETEASTILSATKSSLSDLSDDATQEFLENSEAPPVSEEEMESKSLDAVINRKSSTIEIEPPENRIADISSLYVSNVIAVAARNELAISPDAISTPTDHQIENALATRARIEANCRRVVENAAESESDSLPSPTNSFEERSESNVEMTQTSGWESNHADLDQESSASSGQIEVDMWCHEVTHEEVESGSTLEAVSLEDASTLSDFRQEDSTEHFDQIQVDEEPNEFDEEEELKNECDGKLNGPPKVEKMPFGFFEELVERVAGKKALSPSAPNSDFSTMLAQRAFDVESSKLSLNPATKSDVFASSLAKRAAEVETTRKSSPGRLSENINNSFAKPLATTPRRKLLTHAGLTSKATPESSNSGSSSKFLSDYW